MGEGPERRPGAATATPAGTGAVATPAAATRRTRRARISLRATSATPARIRVGVTSCPAAQDRSLGAAGHRELLSCGSTTSRKVRSAAAVWLLDGVLGPPERRHAGDRQVAQEPQHDDDPLPLPQPAQRVLRRVLRPMRVAEHEVRGPVHPGQLRPDVLDVLALIVGLHPCCPFDALAVPR
ncbi:hypothetical protein Daura_23660 [Dactylosporangium aurantiacum]|uniref:Uncharacterized protein n=1 Tax=Dactylosporangium aurantiacum TaxID=35754 RepID=A0A9Q9MH09_9ACTN|nr:hypothetical protein [Dactylosporangium aurantiacum]MDG6103913.1 hypothetical protein [Dactylosporangium aurantiacum]UWZ58898.1 hypothetical protein Daura_23660 [Dactylosporangium aurantiacum]